MADDSRKLFYSIGEVADIFHVNESTLRFWEKEFPTVIKPKKNLKGTRNYTKDDIENIRLVYFLLKEKGMTLEGARKKLREEKKGMTAQHELTDRLKKIKSELLKLQTELGVPAQEAPEFSSEELISKRMVFAEPGSEMISVESIHDEIPAIEFVMEEIPVPAEEHAPEVDPVFEESPFDFSEEETVPVDAAEDSTDFYAEKFSTQPDETLPDLSVAELASELPSDPEEKLMEEPAEEPVEEPLEELTEEQSDEAAARALYEELEPELIPQPKPEPEPEPTPEQNLFYEQPEPLEPPQPEPTKEGWSGSLF